MTWISFSKDVRLKIFEGGYPYQHFDALRAKFAKGRKNIEAEKLKNTISNKLRQMVTANRTRMDYLKKFQEMIDEYNAGSYNIEAFFAKLTAFAESCR